MFMTSRKNEVGLRPIFRCELAVSFRCKGTFWANLGVHDFVGELLKVAKVRELKVLDFWGVGLLMLIVMLG